MDTNWTIGTIREALEAKRVSARGLTSDFFARIERRNAELNALLALSPDRAFAQADRIDAAIARTPSCVLTFEGGNPPSSTSATRTVSYAIPGTYDTSLKLTYRDTTATCSTQVTVRSPDTTPPTVSISSSEPGPFNPPRSGH